MTLRHSSVVLAILACMCVFASSSPAQEGHLAAHARLVEGLQTGDAELLRSLMAEDSFIVFSLGENRVSLPLIEWLPHFDAMVGSGVTLSVEERDERSGGGPESGWFFSVQEMTWTRADDPEARSTARWNTTEAWELRDGEWKVIHVHHSSAPELEPAPGADVD